MPPFDIKAAAASGVVGPFAPSAIIFAFNLPTFLSVI